MPIFQEKPKLETINLTPFSTLILDMDGTLYQLDGIRHGYSGSTLEATFIVNAIEFIRLQEQCDPVTAFQLLTTAKQNPIGASQFFADRYSFSRRDWFNATWNIDPKPIIQHGDLGENFVARAHQAHKDLILVTQSPSIWQQKVFDHLHLHPYFSAIFTGENFTSKTEIYQQTCQSIGPSNIAVIGDQQHTDIDPATKLGIAGFRVDSPLNLIDFIL